MLNINIGYDEKTGALKIEVVHGALRGSVVIRRSTRTARRAKMIEG